MSVSPEAWPLALVGVTWANTALAGAAALYLAQGRLRSSLPGRGATALAALGATGLLLSLAAGLAGSGGSVGLFEGVALLSAAAVFAYLAMERAFANRAAGAVVMAAVMAVVACEMWLLARGQGPATTMGPGDYWDAAYRFACVLGYGPLALAALASARRPWGFPDPEVAAALVAIGAPLLGLAAGLGATWLVVDPGAGPVAGGVVAITGLAAAASIVASSRRAAIAG